MCGWEEWRKGLGERIVKDCTGTMIVKVEWKRRENINKYM
jgi:hypothetical protein